MIGQPCISGLNDVSTTDILTQADAALEALRLDEIINIDSAGVAPTSGSFFDLIMNKSTDQTFSQANDSLEAIRDRGDAAWITNTLSTTDILTQAQAAVDASTEIDDISSDIASLNDAVDVSTDVNDILTNIAALNDISSTDVLTQVNASTQLNDIDSAISGLNDAVDSSTDVNDILTNIAALNDVGTTDIYTQVAAVRAAAITEPTDYTAMTKSADNLLWALTGRFYNKNIQGTSDQLTYTSTGGVFATRGVTSSTSEQTLNKAT